MYVTLLSQVFFVNFRCQARARYLRPVNRFSYQAGERKVASNHFRLQHCNVMTRGHTFTQQQPSTSTNNKRPFKLRFIAAKCGFPFFSLLRQEKEKVWETFIGKSRGAKKTANKSHMTLF